MKKVLMNWSGGKDSSLCLYYLLKNEEYKVVGLLTSVNEAYNRVSMHGVRESLIQKQADAIGLPLFLLEIPEKTTMDDYNQLMQNSLFPFIEEGVEYCAFGDIFLEDLRAYREEKLAQIGIKVLFPLWEKSTSKLAHQFINDGFESVLSALDGCKLSEKFLGRSYNQNLLRDLPDNVDPCGEFGEFHSFVYNGPIFQHSIEFKKGEVVERVYESNYSDSHSFSANSNQDNVSFWFIDLYEPKN